MKIFFAYVFVLLGLIFLLEHETIQESHKENFELLNTTKVNSQFILSVDNKFQTI